MRRSILILAVGCGPSFQAVYEGDARFEHCYALEETANVSMAQKAACWHQWTLKNTYGQTRDRVDYASARYRALTKAPELPTDEAMMEAAPGMVDTNTQLVAPAPTSAFAPPPNTTPTANDPSKNSDAGSKAVVVVVPAIAARPPNADCIDGCSSNWQECGDAGTCDSTYAKCAAACFSKKK